MNSNPNKPVHFPGFDSLRLVAALAVIFSHGFLIATGSESSEPFVRLLGPGNIAGLYGVFTFFIISGFLLARSLAINSSPIKYVTNRVLRILPGFVVCTLVTAFIIGPIFSSTGAGDYFSGGGIYNFVKTSLNTMGPAQLPGVFAYGSGNLTGVVNGSLWSLRYETLSYVLLLLLWTLFRSSSRVAWVIAAIAIITSISPAAGGLIAGISYTLPYFAAGVLMNSFHRAYGTNKLGAAISALGLVISSFWGMQQLAFAAFGAYLIVFIGEHTTIVSRLTDKIGDCSYGLYLYGWPVEQAVKQWTNTTSPLKMLLIAVPVAASLALISWHVFEKPAIGLRRPVSDRLNRLLRSALMTSGNVRDAAIWGARAAFVLGAAFVLLSKTQWWYFLESMSQICLGILAGSLIAGFMYRAYRAVVPKSITVEGS